MLLHMLYMICNIRIISNMSGHYVMLILIMLKYFASTALSSFTPLDMPLAMHNIYCVPVAIATTLHNMTSGIVTAASL